MLRLHYFEQRLDCGWGRLEVAEAVALRDGQRRPPMLVELVPHVRIRAAARQISHGVRNVLVRGGVHRRLTVLADCIGVVAKFDGEGDRFHHLAISPPIFAGRSRAQSRRDDQRRGAIGGRDLRIGAQRHEEAHQFRIGRERGKAEGSRTDVIEARQAEVDFLRHARVDVRALRRQFLDRFQTGHVARAAGGRIVVAAPGLADGRDGVKDGVSWALGAGFGAEIEQAGREFVVRVFDGDVQRVLPGTPRLGLACPADTCTKPPLIYGPSSSICELAQRSGTPLFLS